MVTQICSNIDVWLFVSCERRLWILGSQRNLRPLG